MVSRRPIIYTKPLLTLVRRPRSPTPIPKTSDNPYPCSYWLWIFLESRIASSDNHIEARAKDRLERSTIEVSINW